MNAERTQLKGSDIPREFSSDTAQRPVGMHPPTSARQWGLTGVPAAWAIIATVALLIIAGRVPLHRDEAATMHYARLPLGKLYADLHAADGVFGLYYLLMHSIRLTTTSDLAIARGMSVLAFGCLVYLAGALGRRLAGRSGAAIASTLTATNPLLVMAALTARPYMLAAALTTIAAHMGLTVVEHPDSRRPWRLAGVLTFVAYLQLFAVLPALCVVAAVLVLNPDWTRTNWRRIAWPSAAFVAALLPLGLIALAQRNQIALIAPTDFMGLLHVLSTAVGRWSGLMTQLLIVSGMAGILLRSRPQQAVPALAALFGGSSQLRV